MAEFLRNDQNLYAQVPFEEPINHLAGTAGLPLPVVRDMMSGLAGEIVADPRYRGGGVRMR